MTREYILQNFEVMCPIIFIDNPGLRDHVMSTLQDSLLIPKPKFKVGDWVEMILGTRKFKIVGALYDYESNAWVYENVFNAFFTESELELVEEKK